MTFCRTFHTLFIGWGIVAGFTAAAADGSLVRPGDIWRFFPGTTAPAANWHTAAFDDSTWSSGASGFSTGFGSYDEATVLPYPGSSYVSVFLRKEFAITNLTDVVWPVLRIDYNDGFAAFLNGIEIARRGLPGESGMPIPHDVLAAPHSRGASEEIDLRPFLGAFITGTNLLALQVHNSNPENATLAVVPELLSGITRGPFLQSTSSNRTLIVWKTALPADSRIEFGETHQLDQVAVDPAPTTNHVIELAGLSPNTRHYYRVSSTRQDGTVQSELHEFRTLKHGGDVRFLVIGDTGVGQPAQYDLARQMAQRGGDLTLHLGDLAYPEFTGLRADAKHFSVYPQMAAQPWFFTIGNHDLYLGETHYLDAFHLPTNSPAGGERYYSFDHGDLHFSVLMVPYLSQYQLTVGDPQYQWLTNDLATTTQPWKVLVYHVPMQTSASHRLDDFNFNGRRDSEEIREVLLPVAEKYGVQVTFSGHDHVFERFAPTNGVHTITTGGGGVLLYQLAEHDAGSVQFWPRHHFTEVAVAGDRMEIRAIDRQGIVFDAQVIHRRPPVDVIHPATWHTPIVESAPANDGDGNLTGQEFDLIGPPLATQPGKFSSLGEVFVNNDKTRLFLGISRALLRADSTVYLFVDSPRMTGVSSLTGLGNGLLDPTGEGADGLDLLENLSFAGFSPALALCLGDELADATYRSTPRPDAQLDPGQGAFLLNTTFDEPAGVHLQQFNRSPQTDPAEWERAADFMEVSIPYAALGGLQPGDIIRLGAVIAGNGHDPAAQRQRLDTGFLGIAMTGSGTNDVVLTGVRVQLAADPDRDGDGLPNDWEIANNLNPDSAQGDDGGSADPDADGATNLHEYLAGTNPHDPLSVFEVWMTLLNASQLELRWQTEPGLRYVPEAATDGSLLFAPLGGTNFPRTATGSQEMFTNDLSPGSTLFRVRRVP